MMLRFQPNGCELVETIILDDDPEQHVVSQATTVTTTIVTPYLPVPLSISDNCMSWPTAWGNLPLITPIEWFKAGTTAAGNLIAGADWAATIDLSALAAVAPSFMSLPIDII